MATRIRLARRGRKKLAIYDVVVADSRSPRDGKFIEKIGQYNPNTNPATIDLKEDKALDWLMKGAEPSDTARAILSYKGLMLRRHLQVGVLKGAITEEQAAAKFEEWKTAKDEKVQGKLDGLSQDKEANKKARLEAESKVKEARAEAIRKKQIVEEEVATETSGDTVVETPEEVAAPEAEVAQEKVVVTEAPNEAEVKEEAPAAEPEAKEEVIETPAAEEKAKEEAPTAEEVKEADDPVAEAQPEVEPEETTEESKEDKKES